jgi:Type IV secretion-system coupling protein DNA-binding domain
MYGTTFGSRIGSAVLRWLEWSDPAYWFGLAALLFVVGLVHPVPWELRNDDATMLEHAILHVRRNAVKLLVIVLLIVPFVSYAGFCFTASANSHAASVAFFEWGVERLQMYWILLAAAAGGGLAVRLGIDRTVMPRLSAWLRARRVTQDEDRLSDARNEAGAIVARSFLPEQYYRAGYMFYGLDALSRPIYIALAVFREIHHAIIGPTRYGKGVFNQVILQQCVRYLDTVFYVDPKGDDYIPYLLQNEAKAAGRPFVYLDLNPTGKGVWHPFKGGDDRGRRARIARAFNLEAGGTDADVYKVRERAILDDALAKTDGTIKALLSAVKSIQASAGEGANDLSSLRDSLSEWGRVWTFAPKKERPGHSISDCLLNNAVVYVRGSINDELVKTATRVYIAELLAEIIRLHPQRTSHVTVSIDELKFLACAEMTSALATLAGFNANMLLSAQSLANIEAPDDRRIDGRSLAREFEVNTQIKLVYRAQDVRTAEWAEGLSGKKWLKVAKNETTTTNSHGGEQWENRRTFTSVEEPVVSINKLLNLPPRVGIAFMPDRLPGDIYTSPVPVDRAYASWEAPPQANASSVQP